jgi:hypothetical protein
MVDVSGVKHIKPVEMKTAVDLLTNSEDYHTEMFYEKQIVNGKTYLRGVFSSLKKDSGKQDFTDDLQEGEVHYANNQVDMMLPRERVERVVNRQNSTLTQFLTYVTLIAFAVELVKYFTYIWGDHKIESDKCHKVRFVQ